MNTQRFLSLVHLVPGVIFILVLAAITAGAQRVPPTAREAATMPQFAHQLARPATTLQRQSTPARGGACSASQRSREPQRSLPQDILYDNGPYNGETDAWTINFGFTVSDSFTVPSNSTVYGLSFVYWDASLSDLLTTVDMALSSTSFGSTIQTLSGVTNTYLGTNQYGYALFKADYTLLGIPWSGDGYITLQNACSTSGCSISNPIYWDENSGPSMAYNNTVGSIPSETFTLTGNVGLPHSPCMPERSGGFNVIHDFTGQGDGGNPSGLVINQAGELFGPTYTIGGTVFKMLQAGSNWVLSTLYNFAGGQQGVAPEEVMIGQNGILYGAAYGGIQNCPYPYEYCGLIFSLRPAPRACRTTSCSWSEYVPYSFTGATDGWRGHGLVSDRAGNLYGVSQLGGTWQQGAVFQLTPSGTSWVESILYSFNGGSDGGSPTTLLLGNDGNLYGMGGTGGANASGVVFRLMPSAGGWSESVLYDLPNTTYWSDPHSLLQDRAGNLFGEYQYLHEFTGGGGKEVGVVFMLAPSGGNWVYTELRHGDELQEEDDVFSNLTLDAAENLWGTGGGSYGCSGSTSHGYIFQLAREHDGWHYSTPVSWDDTEFFTGGALAMDAQGNLYGSTGNCGRHNYGTVWEFTPTQ